jgi:hypothetical protein
MLGAATKSKIFTALGALSMDIVQQREIVGDIDCCKLARQRLHNDQNTQTFRKILSSLSRAFFMRLRVTGGDLGPLDRALHSTENIISFKLFDAW